MKLYSVKYLVSAINSDIEGLMGCFTKLTDNVLDSKTRNGGSVQVEDDRKGKTEPELF